MSFIKEDKKTINLPVPLGTTLYKFNTSCNDACLFQKEKFDKLYPKNYEDTCSQDKLCHTKYLGVEPIVLNINNMEWILGEWDIKVFENEKEADERGREFVSEHIIKFKELGFVLNKDGYSEVTPNN
jgi:hypothetical protein